MQIDLFKDTSFKKEQNRLLAQVETRNFSSIMDEQTLRDTLAADSAYCEKVMHYLQKPKEYKNVYGCNYDSYFNLEALGIGTDCKENIIILDLSEHLDFILAHLMDIPSEIVRNMKNYSTISKAIMQLDYSALVDVKLGDIIDLHPNAETWFENKVTQINIEFPQLLDGEKLQILLCQFFESVIMETNRIKNYAMMYLKMHYDTDFVIRSKTLGAILATADSPCTQELVLYDSAKPDVEPCHITPINLKRLEYFNGGMYNVLSWPN